MERLQKILARAGFGSRRSCEDLILAGDVMVDGKVERTLGAKADASSQEIRCRGRLVRAPRFVYFMLHKPRGAITTARDDRGRKTVMEYLRPESVRTYPVGRLDSESEGLLLFTNDGEWNNLLTHPRYRVQRTYRAVLRGRLDEAVKAKIERGIWLSEGRTSGARIVVKKLLTNETVLDITIREGLNREVRRIFARFGLKVRRLKRIQVGTLTLGSLPPGAYRPLTAGEVAGLRGLAQKGLDG